MYIKNIAETNLNDVKGSNSILLIFQNSDELTFPFYDFK